MTESNARARFGFRMQWMEAVLSSGLPAAEKNLALRIAMHCNDVTGQCNPSEATLAKGKRLTPRYLRTLKAKLSRSDGCATPKIGVRAMAALVHGESLTLFPSEESKERKWAIVFSVSSELIGAPRDLREPLERSFDVQKQFFRLRIALFFGVAAYLFGSLYVQFHRTRQHALLSVVPSIVQHPLEAMRLKQDAVMIIYLDKHIATASMRLVH